DRGPMRRIQLYDTTLRDGAQSEDVRFTLDDKLRITERLDDLGIHYVEGGWRGSNPRDEEFLRAVRGLRLRQTKIAAFGATRRAGIRAEADRNLEALLRAATPVVTIVGKTWDLHVRDDLRIPLEENLDVIRDSVAFLASRVAEVIFDAEHFFDGWLRNPDYALASPPPPRRGPRSCASATRVAGRCRRRSVGPSTRRRVPSRLPASASTVTTTPSWRSRTRSRRSSGGACRCRAR